MKKAPTIFILFTLICIAAYIVSNLIRQNRNDKQFICDCRNSKNISGSFFLELPYDPESIRDMKIQLNQKGISTGPIKIHGDQQPYLYEYDHAFGSSDTVIINIASKKYVISEFETDTVITNSKKGLECRLKSAKINNVVQHGDRYKLLR